MYIKSNKIHYFLYNSSDAFASFSQPIHTVSDMYNMWQTGIHDIAGKEKRINMLDCLSKTFDDWYVGWMNTTNQTKKKCTQEKYSWRNKKKESAKKIYNKMSKICFSLFEFKIKSKRIFHKLLHIIYWFIYCACKCSVLVHFIFLFFFYFVRFTVS